MNRVGLLEYHMRNAESGLSVTDQLGGINAEYRSQHC